MPQTWLTSVLRRIQTVAFFPTGRALIFFRTTPFYKHFLEQCVTSYPSALDENAPFYAKLVLLAVSGVFEYFTFVEITASAAYVFENIRMVYTIFIQHKAFDGYGIAPYEKAILAPTFEHFASFSFALRAKSFLKAVRRQTPQIHDGQAPNL